MNSYSVAATYADKGNLNALITWQIPLQKLASKALTIVKKIFLLQQARSSVMFVYYAEWLAILNVNIQSVQTQTHNCIQRDQFLEWAQQRSRFLSQVAVTYKTALRYTDCMRQ